MSASLPPVSTADRLALGSALGRVVVLPALLLALFTVVLIWQVSRLREELRWVTHTDAVLDLTNESLVGVLNVQRTLRGYLITGGADHLAKLQRFRSNVEDAIPQLEKRVEDNPAQMAAARRMRILTVEFLRYCDDMVAGRGAGLDAAIRLQRGEELVDQLRAGFQQFADVERALRLDRRETVQTTASFLIVSGIALVFAGAFVFAVVARRELRRISETYREALEQATNDRLRMEEARDSAEAASRAKDQFLAMVSHELRNPLMPILTWTTLLRDAQLGDEARQRGLESIERSARSLTQLIDDLLDVSRIVSGKLRLDVRSIELVPVINAALEAARPAADAKQVRLQVVLDPRAGPIAGDPERLQQVAWNLLSNAIKFTPKGGRVHVALARINSHLELTVSDTGQGIEAALLPHVFERFWQAETGSTRQRAGLGLGLAIVRHLVELHGGSVEVHSDGADKGAVFKVQLPLLVTARTLGESSTQTALQPSDGPASHPLAGVRVMVVDDDAASLDAVALLLSHAGAEVHTAASTAQALNAIRQCQPDVLLSDIEMPGEDGYALIRTVRSWSAANGGEIPAVALTAYARVDDRVRVLGAGFQMHVIKPAEPAELIAVVANLAGRRSEAATS